MNPDKMLHVVAAPGRLVRWPNARPLAPGGDRVPRTPFWMRRLESGDVLEVPAAGDVPDAVESIDSDALEAEKVSPAALEPPTAAKRRARQEPA